MFPLGAPGAALFVLRLPRDIALDAHPCRSNRRVRVPWARDPFLRISLLSHGVLRSFGHRRTGYISPRHLHLDKRSFGNIGAWGLLG